ncbi:hypothetical protein ACQJBY_026960 [Aegilops geniculata]
MDGRYGDQAGEITQDYLHATGNALQDGEITQDYHIPVGVVLFNPSEADFVVKLRDCVTEMIVQVIATLEVAEVEDLDANATGVGWGGGGGGGRVRVHGSLNSEALVDTSREVVCLFASDVKWDCVISLS